MVSNERVVFFKRDETANSLANQSILEDGSEMEDLDYPPNT